MKKEQLLSLEQDIGIFQQIYPLQVLHHLLTHSSSDF
jgi:hypothetical protein